MSSNPKVVGIVADNYKLSKYKSTLLEKGFKKFTTHPFTKDTTTIKVETTEDKILTLHNMCELLEASFKRRN